MKYKFPSDHHRVFSLNPELKTVPEFDLISNKKMCFVMLVCDPDSPLRYIKYEEGGGSEKMREAAVRALGYTTPTGKLSLDGAKMVNNELRDLQLAEEVYKKIIGHDTLECLLEMKAGIQSFVSESPTKLDEKIKWVTQMKSLVKDDTITTLNKQITQHMNHMKTIEVQDMIDSKTEEEEEETQTGVSSSAVAGIETFDIDRMHELQ